MSAVTANVQADIVTWLITTVPVFVLHHILLRRHVTKTTQRQTATLQDPSREQKS